MNSPAIVRGQRLAVLLGIIATSPLAVAQTAGSVSFSVTLAASTGGYSPKHYVVAWVTKADGTFIKTLWKQGKTSFTSSEWTDNCPAWNTARGSSTAFDGYTSATAQTYTVTNPSPPASGTASNPIAPVWNCLDANNALVPDGDYKFWVQYGFADAAGPLTTSGLTWTKRSTSFSKSDYTITGTYASSFSNMSIVWTPAVATAPEIAVEQPAGTNIADGGSKDFGSLAVGSNTSLTFTIKNTGDANLTGLGITKSGTNAGDFTVTANPVAPVSGPTGTTTFTVRFAPTAAGTRSATLQIASNDSDENPFDITLTGTGTAPEIAVEQPAGTNIADGGTKNFGAVPVGSNLLLSFTIKNTGTTNLTGLGITKSGANESDFIIVDSPVAPVSGPSGTTTFTVLFVPAAAGTRTATLQIASNDSDENPFDINLTGTGVAPPGGIVAGSKNIGAVWFIGDSITQSNADGDANGSPRKALYDLLTANGYTFSFTGHSTANVDGLPTTGASADTNLYHYHSGISGSVIGNDVSGRTGMTQNLPNFWVNGRLATVKPNVVLIMLGTNDVDQNIDLANAPARLTALINTLYAQPGVGTPSVFIASIPPNRTNLPADQTNTASFNAAVPGVVSAQRDMGRDVRFVDQFTPLENAYANNMMADNLHTNTTGNATLAQQWYTAIANVVTPPAPVIAVQQPAGTALVSGTSTIAFGSSLIGTGVPVTFTVKNTGNATLSGIALTCDGTGRDDFAVTTAPATSVVAGGSTTFIMTFTPSASGTRTAALHIASNDTARSPFNINLTGTGVVPSTPFAGWISAAGVPAGQAAPNQCPHGDGVSNLMKYACNLDPTKADARVLTVGANATAGLPVITRGGNGKLHLEFIRRRNEVASGITYRAEFSSDLAGWVDLAALATTAPIDATWERVSVDDVQPSGASARFARVEVILNPSGAVPLMVVEQAGGIGMIDGMSTAEFGSTPPGAPVSVVFTIRNSGSADLTGLAAAKDGPCAAEYALATTPAATLAPGASTTFTVVFTPTAAGARRAALHLSNNDTRNMPFDFTLSGNGVSTSPYEAWISAAGIPLDKAGPQQSPFNDGVTNLGKFAFNLDPTKADFRQLAVGAGQTAGRPGTAMLGGKLRLEFIRRKAAAQPGITYVAEFSANLLDWAPSNAVAVVTPIDETWERVVIDDTPPPNSGTRFGRVRVVQTP